MQRDISERHSGQNAGYRIRVRRCVDCRVSFESVEMPKETFDALLFEFVRLREKRMEQRRKTQDEFEVLRAAVEVLDDSLGAKKRREYKAIYKAKIAAKIAERKAQREKGGNEPNA